jgi:hypothetical protein
MTKPQYKSQTIRNAYISFLITLATVGVSLYDTEESQFRPPNQVEVAAILVAMKTLQGTIEGRKKAVEPIGVERPEDTPSSSYYIPVEPNYETVAELPSAEFITPEESFIEDSDSVDNEEYDTLDIDFSKLTGKYYLVAQTDTKLKTSPEQSSELSPENYREVEQWQRIDIDFWNFLPEKNEHIEVKIDEYKHTNGGNFYVYAPHFKLFNILDKEIEIESPSSPVPIVKKDRGKAFKLPGNTSTFYTKDPIYPGSHFTWGEATKNGTRIPENATIVSNIIKQAKELDKLRAHLGVPLMVTSYYRDPRSNAAVGGASRSSHLTGLATDIFTPAMSANQLQAKVIDFWKAGGIGKGAAKGFVHVSSDGWLRIFTYG